MARASRSELRRKSVRAGIARHYQQLGFGPVELSTPVIEAYCRQLEGSSSTRGTYRSVLRGLSPSSAPLYGPSYRAAPAGLPYSATEIAALVSTARSQRQWRAHSALVLICLCAGAGMRQCELVAARVGDVERSGEDLAVRVRGDLARVVGVRGVFATLLGPLARGGAGEHLFHPAEADRSYPNFVNDFCINLRNEPGGVHLSVRRARSTYICGLLAGGVPLSRVLALTGIAEVESLLRYTRLVPGAPESKALLRATLAAGG